MTEDARPYLKRLPGDRYQLASSSGADLTVHDYRLVDGHRRVLRLGHQAAQYRAFVAKTGPIRVYRFRDGEAHKPDPLVLQNQLNAAEVLGARYDVTERQPR